MHPVTGFIGVQWRGGSGFVSSISSQGTISSVQLGSQTRRFALAGRSPSSSLLVKGEIESGLNVSRGGIDIANAIMLKAGEHLLIRQGKGQLGAG